MPDHISLWDLLLTIRKSFDQYVNLRPITLLKGAPCPLKNVRREDIDMLFVRENSEGEEEKPDQYQQGKCAELLYGILGADI